MSSPFVGEIRLFAGNFPPNGWAFCDGQVVSIAELETLFNLIGTTYGGDGQSTFALPDLRGRVPVHQGAGSGSNYVIGQSGGVETVAITQQQLPSHSHPLNATSVPASATAGPTGMLAASPSLNFYGTAVPTQPMAAGAVTAIGAGLPHDNLAPFLAVNFIISLFGIFPSQS